MIDLRRIIIILVVAVLFAVFVFSTINAVYPDPEYEDYCRDEYAVPKPIREVDNSNCPDHNISQEEIDACVDTDGRPSYKYDAYGCVTSWECTTCHNDYDAAQEKHHFWSFIISAIFGLIGVMISLFMPMEKETVHEWVGSGLMLGGMFAIFFGTAIYYGDLHRYIRPVVILIELILVIILAYKKLAPKK
ncbi:hypothetical protein ACFL1B_00900 [Nanoarchaeota archaeon]